VALADAVDLGPLERFAVGRFTIVTLEGKELGVLRWGAEVYIVRNICPHAYAPICRGVVTGRLHSAGVRELSADETTPVVRCPWHRWEFRLSDGRALRDPRLHLKLYPCRVEDGRLLVELSSRRRAIEGAR
jgi:nitrite reductase/ring-hydroxylating ferredoxin subunit